MPGARLPRAMRAKVRPCGRPKVTSALACQTRALEPRAKARNRTRARARAEAGTGARAKAVAEARARG
eukprot:5385944-Pyramimonas_sp.AAC.1